MWKDQKLGSPREEQQTFRENLGNNTHNSAKHRRATQKRLPTTDREIKCKPRGSKHVVLLMPLGFLLVVLGSALP